MKKILIVDDEPDIVRLLEHNLQREGFGTLSATNGVEALKRIKAGGISLVVLDLMLPEMDGYEVLRRIRQSEDTAHLPVIMLTAKGEELDRVLGLEMGADDYVTKPFSPRELLARIKAVLRRIEEKSQPQGIIKKADLVIDNEKFEVKKAGKTIELSAKEFKLLSLLASRPGKVFSREMLLDEVWGDEVYVEPRTVDVQIRRLREKLEDDPSRPVYILTKRGVGYFFSGGMD
ncbi:MAG: DNA-binding response regulator [Nitrospirae bacterium]|nr:MAG: DNA-binding response regulator [Nitrospirota bacterium]